MARSITINPAIVAGKPVIGGKPAGGEFIIDSLAQGWLKSEILRNYPGILADLFASMYTSTLHAGESAHPLRLHNTGGAMRFLLTKIFLLMQFPL